MRVILSFNTSSRRSFLSTPQAEGRSLESPFENNAMLKRPCRPVLARLTLQCGYRRRAKARAGTAASRDSTCKVPADLQLLLHVPTFRPLLKDTACHVPVQQGPTHATRQVPLPGMASVGTPLQVLHWALLNTGRVGNPGGAVGIVVCGGGGEVVLEGGRLADGGGAELEEGAEALGVGAVGEAEGPGAGAAPVWASALGFKVLSTRRRMHAWAPVRRVERAAIVARCSCTRLGDIFC